MNFQFAFFPKYLRYRVSTEFFELISNSIFLPRNFARKYDPPLQTVYHDIRHNLVVFTQLLFSSRKCLLKTVKFQSNFQQKCKQAVCGYISISVVQKEVLVANALYFDTSKKMIFDW